MMQFMGKKIIFAILFSFIYLSFVNPSMAQSVEKIGWINSVELLESIPDKVKATKAINELNQKYKDELALMQADYNRKYSDFISWQNTMAESIKLRRMQELYELEKNMNEFMRIAQEDITSQEEQLIKPLKEKLSRAVELVGQEQGFTCIYDKSNPSIMYLTPMAIDANTLVKKKILEIR